MVLTIGIIGILIFGFFRGLHRGFVNEILSLIGFLAATIVSIAFTSPIADFINHAIFQNGGNQSAQMIIKWFIFAMLFGFVWRMVHLLGDLLSPITRLPLLHQLNALLGGASDLLIKYLFIFILLNFLVMFPDQSIREQYQQSVISQWIVKKTPILSDKMIQIWNQHSSEVNL